MSKQASDRKPSNNRRSKETSASARLSHSEHAELLQDVTRVQMCSESISQLDDQGAVSAGKVKRPGQKVKPRRTATEHGAH